MDNLKEIWTRNPRGVSPYGTKDQYEMNERDARCSRLRAYAQECPASTIFPGVLILADHLRFLGSRRICEGFEMLDPVSSNSGVTSRNVKWYTVAPHGDRDYTAPTSP